MSDGLQNFSAFLVVEASVVKVALHRCQAAQTIERLGVVNTNTSLPTARQ